MAKLTSFWQLLESRNDKTAVLAEWKQRVGDSFGVVNPLLTPTGRYASAYPHPKPYGLKLHVIKHRNGEIVAVCPEDSDIRIALTKTDIALFHINIEKLRKALSDALSLVPAQNAIQSVSDYILLGKYRPKPAADFSVYMVIAKPQSFISIIKDLCQMPKPFILLVTSMKYCSEEAHVLIDKKSSIVVPLDDVLEYSGTQIQCTQQWNQCLSVFAQKVNPTGRSNFANKPTAKNAQVSANATKIKKELNRWLREQYKLILDANDDEIKPHKLPKLTKTLLGALLDLKPFHVSRAFQFDSELEEMFMATGSVEAILQYVERKRNSD
jgi:hypothetical protein